MLNCKGRAIAPSGHPLGSASEAQTAKRKGDRSRSIRLKMTARSSSALPPNHTPSPPRKAQFVQRSIHHIIKTNIQHRHSSKTSGPSSPSQRNSQRRLLNTPFGTERRDGLVAPKFTTLFVLAWTKRVMAGIALTTSPCMILYPLCDLFRPCNGPPSHRTAVKQARYIISHRPTSGRNLCVVPCFSHLPTSSMSSSRCVC